MSFNEWMALAMLAGFFGMLMLGIPIAISLAVS